MTVPEGFFIQNSGELVRDEAMKKYLGAYTKCDSENLFRPPPKTKYAEW